MYFTHAAHIIATASKLQDTVFEFQVAKSVINHQNTLPFIHHIKLEALSFGRISSNMWV